MSKAICGGPLDKQPTCVIGSDICTCPTGPLLPVSDVVPLLAEWLKPGQVDAPEALEQATQQLLDSLPEERT